MNSNKIATPIQLNQKITIHASQEKVWKVFNDQSLLPKWTCDVQLCYYEEKMASPGQLRKNECIVNGKPGQIETRCLNMQPNERAEFQVEKDTFGMTKLLKGMSFASEFKKIDENTTEFTMLSHYEPGNLFIRLMNPIIKRKMGKEVELMLKGLKEFTEKGTLNTLNPVNRQ